MRRKLGLAAAEAVVLAVGSITVAFAGSSDSRSAEHRVQVIRLLAKSTEDLNLDFGRHGFSAGDQEVFADNLFQDGKRVGRDGGVCQAVRVTKASAAVQCVMTVSLAKGQITAQGLVTSTSAGPGTFVIAITGGAGAYQTAHGQVKITATSTGEVPLTLYLIL